MELDNCVASVLNNSVPKFKTVWYEWACIKAYLSDKPHFDCQELYQELFNRIPEDKLETAPKGLIILACMWKGLERGYKRAGRVFPGLEAQCLALLASLDENALNDNKKLKVHIRSGNADILS